MLDEDFEGDTLVIGGYCDRHPNKLTLNVDGGGHIAGSGWDDDLLAQLTPGKYAHILYEHVGYSLSRCAQDDFASASDLAKAHFKLLKPGGTFDFLSWGFVFDGAPLGIYSDDVRMFFEYGKKTLKCGLENGSKTLVQLDGDETLVANHLKAGLAEFTQNGEVMSTVSALYGAGFRNIQVRKEQHGVLGFALSHGGLHYSAQKPGEER